MQRFLHQVAHSIATTGRVMGTFLASCLLLSGFLHMPAAAATAVDLGPGIAYGINNVGQIVGSGSVVWDADHRPIALRELQSDPYTHISAYLDGTRGINDRGSVVGTNRVSFRFQPYFSHPVVWSNPFTPAPLNVQLEPYAIDQFTAEFNAVALGINNGGTVVGWVDRSGHGETHAFLSGGNGELVDIHPRAIGSAWSEALAINNHQQVVGRFELGFTTRHAFIWDSAHGIQDIHPPQGASFKLSIANAINDNGEVAGGYGRDGNSGLRAAYWDTGRSFHDLGVLPGVKANRTSVAYGINNLGQVVGSSQGDDGKNYAFLWDAVHGMVDLGGPDTVAYGINNRGQVVGSAVIGGVTHAVLWSADQSAPVTTAGASGPQGNNGWYTGPVTVTLSASDADGAADVKATYYRLDSTSGSAPATYAGPLSISSDGTHTLTYWSVDQGGNVEAAHTLTLMIDGTPPAVQWGSPMPAPSATGWNNTPVDLPFTVSDNLSGVVAVNPPSPLHFTAEGAGQTQQVTVTDAAGNVATLTSPAVNLDFTAPATTAGVAGPMGNNGWYTGPVMVTLVSTDPLSDVARIFYTVDGGAPQVYTAPFSVSEDGIHNISFWAREQAGNTEPAQSLTLRIDGTSPSVQWGTPSPTPNASGWYKGTVDVPFTLTDNLSGIASANPPGPLHLTGEGWNVTGTVTVTDAAGNTATLTSPPAKIDRTAPHTTATVAGAGGQNGWYVRPVTVHLEGTDALSGVAGTYYQVDGGATQPFASNFTLATLGTHQLQFWSVDRAGNMEATQSLTLRLEPAAPVVTIRAVPPSPNAPNNKTATVTVSGTVFSTQAGLDPQQVGYTVADRAGNTAGSGRVTLDKRGQYHFTVRLLGPGKGGAPLAYVVTVQAVDRGGARGQASALVTVR